MEEKRAMKRKIVLVLVLVSVGIAFFGGVAGYTFGQLYYKWSEPDWPPKMTYAYANENGWCIPGPSGVYDRRKYGEPDVDRYIPDETVIFGPFDHMPYLEFEIADANLAFNTDGLNICDNYMEKYMHTGEERLYYYEDTIVGLASTLYEDGEIYVAVKFYKTVTDSSGKDITVMMEWENKPSAEDEARFLEEQASGARDYFLAYASDGAHIILRYEENYLSVVKNELQGDIPQNHPYADPYLRGNAPVGGGR